LKVLIIKFRNIGDVLLVGPLVSSLKSQDPTLEVSVMVKHGTEAMIQAHPHADEVLVYPHRETGESRWRYFRRELAWVRSLRKRRFDMVINTTEGDRGAILGYLIAPRRIGPVKPGDSKRWRTRLYTEPRALAPGRRHTVIRNLDLLPTSLQQRDRRVRLTFAEADLTRVKAILTKLGWKPEQPLVQVHPTSRWFFKCWNSPDVAQIIDYLQRERHLQVVVTSGPDQRERDRVAQIRTLCESTPLDVSGQLTLKETAALTSLCRLFFGVDTAPMHMAAALDVPVVALFGPSGAFDWGPWPNDWDGEATPYPLQSGVQQCGPHTVIQKNWPCVPCGRDGCEGSKRSACLEQLNAPEVVPVLDQAMARADLA
jgi:heptosyltransferase-3